MWRRIQTLYLAISTGLIAAMFFCDFATIVGPEGDEIIIRYYEKFSFLSLMIMLLTAHVCALFSFKSWALQSRVAMISCLLALAFQIFLGVDFIRMHGKMVFNISGIFPIACVILDALASRAAMIDHFTLTAVDSTRKAGKNRRKARNQ